MDIQFQVEQFLQAVADCIFAGIPQKQPEKETLQKCKIVSHRGEHDNQSVLENTIPAFDLVHDRGIWGIELDIRWTKDLKPVVIHDPDCRRVFGTENIVNKETFKELKTRLPFLPSLEEIIQKYGKKLHLMVELKKEHYPRPRYQSDLLMDLFSNLEPMHDFHFISLSPEMFQHVGFVPNNALLPVAEFNFREFSELALQNGYGGLTGHYLLMNQEMVKKHEQAGQKVGTGFPSSGNCLFRELNRGVEWVFSNQAVKLQTICDSILQNQ
ncbi:MAG: glycerophosphodiester phosphodiesterase [SAR324 cluster bacterium]|nr:glycerophosphodiester phosphodiesterase [SAR324 cluster bacterium]